MRRMMMVAVHIALAVALTAAGSEWYVDPVNGLDTRDGTTSNVVSETVGPRRTLEKAMELVNAGDTLWLLPGEYSEGSMRDGRARIFVDKKNVKVKSTDGAARTFIVGEGGTVMSSTSSKGCMHVDGAGVIVEGITFRDGCGQRHGSIKDNGGGLKAVSTTWAIDCVFTNCYAHIGGGMYSGNALRCRFVNCRASSSGGGAAYANNFAFCLFQKCTPSSYKSYSQYLPKFYNCTFCATTGDAFVLYDATSPETVMLCNSIVVGHAANGARTLYATNCVLGAATLSVDAVNCVSNVSLTAAGLLAPFNGDVRVATRSAAVNRGDASLLANIALPSGYSLTDLLGNPVPASGPITAGCVLETVEQTGASLTFSGRSYEVQGYGTFGAGETLCPTSVPAALYIRPVLSEGQHLWGLSAGDKLNSTVYYRQPLADGWVPFAPFASAESNMTVTAQLATGVWYADAEHGNDDWDGTADYAHRDESNNIGPKQTLQAAHDAATGNYPLVYAAPGVYSNGFTTVTAEKNGNTYTCRRRVHSTKGVGFRSTAGAEQTFIVGAPDPDTGGLGDNAIAGVQLDGGGSATFLQGFTITGCYSPNRESSYIQKGAAFASGSYRAWLHDCIISNNYSYQGICSYGVISRCRVLDNTSYWYTAGYAGSAYSSIFAGNNIRYADSGNTTASGFAYGYGLYGCTIDLRSSTNRNGRARFAADDAAKAYNCLVLGYNGKETACFVDTLALKDMPVADAAAYDYRLGVLSPAVGAAAYAEMEDFAQRGASFDVDGRPVVVKNGRSNIGAVQNDPPLPCVVIAGGGRDAITGGYAPGTNVVTSGGDVTVTVGNRPFTGFEVDGALLPYAGRSYTFAAPTEPGLVKTVRVVYDPDWYVDCVNGDDANDGAAGRPVQTIRSATTNAVAGDVIHVAPGTYGAQEGAQAWPDDTATIGTRVVIPAGVTVESTDGATNTFIVGAASPNPAVTEGWQTGIGPGAVRCVVAEEGATLRGFTLKDGYTDQYSSTSDDGLCSAFYSTTMLGATLEDCVVTNNVAGFYTIRQAVVRRCRVLGNTAASATVNSASGAAGIYCAWYNSIIAGNRGNATVHNAVAFENCTMGSGNVMNADGLTSQALYFADGNDHAIVNSAILAGRYYIANAKFYCTNCLVMAGQTSSVLRVEQSYNTIFTNASGARVDSEYRPIFGSFAGIDAGDATYSSETLGEKDVYGTSRILNGAIDIGAVEYDWRPTFAGELGRRFKIADVSPSVTTNATGGLLVPDGVVAGTATSASSYEIAFSVTGGSLAVYVGGDLAGESSGTGAQSIRFIVPNAADEIRFVFTPDAESPGAAVLQRFVGALGFSISIR